MVRFLHNTGSTIVLLEMYSHKLGASLVAQMGKESACNVGDPGSIPGSGRSSGEGNAYPFQYSCLENSMDRGAWQAIVIS